MHKGIVLEFKIYMFLHKFEDVNKTKIIFCLIEKLPPNAHFYY